MAQSMLVTIIELINDKIDQLRPFFRLDVYPNPHFFLSMYLTKDVVVYHLKQA